MSQQFIQTVVELDGLSLKNRDLVIQLLMEISHFGISKIERERKWIFPRTGSGFHTSKK